MLQQTIIEKINNIFGKVDVYFDADDLTLTNRLAILVNNFEAFPLNNSNNVEEYHISASFTFPIIHNNGWNIDLVINRITEYNQKEKDKVNIIYPYNVGSDIDLSLEFVVDIPIAKQTTRYPMKDAEMAITT
ncbi:MAG: hypothetical protein FWE18_00165 [Alphaproteobacteria bacterium]|nr:hypothetical protein [Alphaproteobacteria bacterium]